MKNINGKNTLSPAELISALEKRRDQIYDACEKLDLSYEEKKIFRNAWVETSRRIFRALAWLPKK